MLTMYLDLLCIYRHQTMSRPLPARFTFSSLLHFYARSSLSTHPFRRRKCISQLSLPIDITGVMNTTWLSSKRLKRDIEIKMVI